SRRPQPAAFYHLCPAAVRSAVASLCAPGTMDKEPRRPCQPARGSLSAHPRLRGGGVLKITRLSPKGRGLTIKLEGEILEPCVGSVRDAGAAGGGRPRCLDLAAVTYVDAAGVQLLRDLMAEGVEIAACSSFVRALLHLEP